MAAQGAPKRLLEAPLGFLFATQGGPWNLLGVLGDVTSAPGKLIFTIWGSEDVILYVLLRFYQASAIRIEKTSLLPA